MVVVVVVVVGFFCPCLSSSAVMLSCFAHVYADVRTNDEFWIIKDYTVTPTLPHGIVIFRVENPKDRNEYSELKWLPPVSTYWCKEIGGCVDGYGT